MNGAENWLDEQPSRRVLIVEDDQDGRETLQALLVAMGHQTDSAADGAEALEKGLALQPEIALIDLGLPVLDGCQVARRLRASLGPGVVLLACTAYDEPEDRRRAYEAGFQGYLVKPLNIAKLAGWLRM
jgi:CheY-like chemotaxis protein